MRSRVRLVLGSVLLTMVCCFTPAYASTIHSAQASHETQAARPTLRRGDRGSAVHELQQRLNVWIRNSPRAQLSPLPITGYFGPATEQAVKAFQGAMGLPTSGIVAARTWALLPSLPVAMANPCAGIPRSVNAIVEGSNCVYRGVVMNFQVFGFYPGERVRDWQVRPDGVTVPTSNAPPSAVLTDGFSWETEGQQYGLWTWVFESQERTYRATIYFRIVPRS
jgi:peptidoglycan hydrolase-like protein with peptidoglycan-binding domain